MSNIIEFPTRETGLSVEVVADNTSYTAIVKATLLLCASLQEMDADLFCCEINDIKLSNGKLNISIQELQE